MVKKVTEYIASDGSEFDDEEAANHHQKLLDLHGAYEKASNRLVEALASQFQTADGETFSFKRYGDYYLISNRHYGEPRIERISFWIRDVDISQDGVIHAYRREGDHGVMRSYIIADLYYHERHALVALLQARRERAKQMAEDIESLKNDILEKYGPLRLWYELEESNE